MSLNQETLREAGLTDRFVRHRAVKRLLARGWLEVRGTNTPGRKLEYRLNPNWALPKAKVVDLGTASRGKVWQSGAGPVRKRA